MKYVVVAAALLLAGCNTLPTQEEWSMMTPAEKEYWHLKQEQRKRLGAAFSAMGAQILETDRNRVRALNYR